jgi:hypothetical protein
MANQNGRPSGKAPKPELIDKEARVVALRRQGYTWDSISSDVGYSSPSSSRDAFIRASRRVLREDVEEVRNLELDRLDLALKAIWAGVEAGDIPAINTMLKIMERRSKMLALDAPKRVFIQDDKPPISVEDLERRIQQIMVEDDHDFIQSLVEPNVGR